MSTTPTDNDLTQLESYIWARRSLVALAVVAWTGFALTLASNAWELDSLEPFILCLLGVGIPLCMALLALLYRAVGLENALPKTMRDRLRATILLTGPGGALEAIIQIRKLQKASRQQRR